MKRKLLSYLTLLLSFVALYSCNKNAVVVNNNNNNTVNNNTDSSLLPLKAGNKWVYFDSVFSSTNVLDTAFIDTAYTTNQTYATNQLPGYTFVGYWDSGWFNQFQYMANAIDQNGYQYVLTIDSISNPYYFYSFETVPYDNYSLGHSIDSVSNRNCSTNINYYGFSTRTTINGYPCLKNNAVYTNCNNTVTEVANTFFYPKVGFVRMEDHKQDTTLPNKPLFLQYSHTLKQFIPK